MPQQAQPPAVPLEAGVSVEQSLAPGERHSYLLELEPGTWLVEVEQIGVDLTLEASGPDGYQLGPADSPIDRLGTETLLIRSSGGGSYQVQVFCSKGETASGSFAIQASRLDTEDPRGRSRADAEEARMQAAQLYYQGNADAWRQAIQMYQKSLGHWQALGMESERARDLYSIGALHRLLSEHEAALEHYSQALPIWESLELGPQQAVTLNDMGLCHLFLRDRRQARSFFERAIPLYQGSGDGYGEAAATTNLCFISQSEGELHRAMTCYEKALGLIRAAGATQLEAVAWNNLSGVYDTLGRPQEALESNRHVLDLLETTENPLRRGQTLNNRARLHRRLGENDEALLAYEKALTIFRSLGNQRWEATVLNNLGFYYYNLREPQRAAAFFEQALPLRRQSGDRRGEALTLSNLALARSRLGDPHEALQLYQQALALMEAAGSPLDRASTLNRMSRLHIELKDLPQALQLAEQALELAPAEKSRNTAAESLEQMGRILLLRDQPQQARSPLEESLQLRRLAGDPVGEFQSLTLLARTENRLQAPAQARQRLEEALKVIESLRTQISSPDLRSAFWSSLREAYELYIDLLMEAHRREPQAGHQLAALQASESARSRTLIEMLQESGAQIRQGIRPDLAERERALRSRLNALAESRMKLMGRPGGEAEAGLMDHEIQTVLAEVDQVEAQIRRSNPAYASLTRPGPLDSAEIQGLLDEETLILEYALGEQRSFLWCVSRDRVHAFELPGRSEIEAAARPLYEQLSKLDLRSRQAESRAAAALSRMLLAPAAQLLEGRRLAVVADGVLHYIPFAALPEPEQDGQPLLARHEIVYLPSASALAVQRRQLAGRPAAPGLLAVLADPVFEASDGRLGSPGKKAPPGQAEGQDPQRGSDGSAFERLPSTRREAEAIAALAPPEMTWTALDFEASRSSALDRRLAGYRFVHFATHGWIDSRHPELSGLVLSRFDRQGNSLNGFLRLQDAYNLRLNAELVVLSGCRTALGEEIRGEGLVGLARGFMYAGAARVVASLWRVQDRATADLMERFYRLMLAQGLRPAAALREAQLSIWRRRERRDPYFWAAFVLQGDWR